MKKLILLSILTFLIFQVSISQEYGWQLINTTSIVGTPNFSDVHAVDEDVVFISCSSQANIFRTDDGADSFTTQDTSLGTTTQAIDMIDASIGFCGGQSGFVYNTDDGGTNWGFLGTMATTLTDLDFVSPSQGYACGDGGAVFSIANGSVSNLNSPSSSTFRGISAPSINNVWVCGGNRIYYYNGTDFTSQIAPAGTFNDIHFINNQEGWVVGNSGIMGYTEDGGINWITQTNPDTQNRTLSGVFFFDSDYGWAVGVDGVILSTSNGGSTWSVVGAGLTTEVLSSVHFSSTTNGYVAGNEKTLLKYAEILGTGNELVETLQFDIYPNPATNKIQIQCSEFKTQSGIMEICSIDGKEILKTKIRQGNENVEIDIANVETGMYFCTLRTDNKSSTKKLIIE